MPTTLLLSLRNRPIALGGVVLAGAVLPVATACASGSPDGSAPRSSVVSAALGVAADHDCAVGLTKLSYDDPGTDDDELVALRVEGSPSPGATLADCGLAQLVHLNGSASGCGDAIVTVELGAVVVPDDAIVLVCTRSDCDVSPERDGWLQNGPDALRFVATGGSVTAQIFWEGDPNGCFALSPAIPSFEALTEAPGDVDDYNAWCGEGFVLLDASASSRRAPNACPEPPREDAALADAASLDGTADARPFEPDAGALPEVAPGPAAEPDDTDPDGARGFDDPPGLLEDDDALGPSKHPDDAGTYVFARPPARHRGAFGCGVAPRKSMPWPAAWLLVTLPLGWRRARRDARGLGR